MYFFLALSLLVAQGMAPRALERHSFSHPQMGTLFRIICYAESRPQAERAAEAAFSRIDSLNSVFSDYDPDSELSGISATAGKPGDRAVSEDLWALLVQAQELARLSEGAFDITIGPLSRLWRWSFRRQQWPPHDRLTAARKAVGYEALELKPDTRSVQLLRDSMRLDAGGIAKGYAVDAAMKVLQAHGIRHALVDGGGDMLASQAPPGAEAWVVELPPVEGADSLLLLANEAIATSGDTYRYLEWEGKRYSHIIDPRTGLGVDHGALVTVRAPSCSLADALASTLTVLDPNQHGSFLSHFENVAARIILPGDPPTLSVYNAFHQP